MAVPGASRAPTQTKCRGEADGGKDCEPGNGIPKHGTIMQLVLFYEKIKAIG